LIDVFIDFHTGSRKQGINSIDLVHKFN